MDPELKGYLIDFLPLQSEGASIIMEVTKGLNFNIQPDYIEFLSEVDGGEGAIGTNSYLILWPSGDLLANNADYNTASFANDYFLIGQDAADTAYGIKKSDGMIYEFGFLADLKTDPAEFCGITFLEFIRCLYFK